MKSLLAVIASTFFAAGVSAHDIYGELGEGNSDVFDEHQPKDTMAAVQPSVGDHFDRYQGFADGNPDLFRSDRGGPSNSGDDPRIYGVLTGDSNLSY
jgi:hypothetical protein